MEPWTWTLVEWGFYAAIGFCLSVVGLGAIYVVLLFVAETDERRWEAQHEQMIRDREARALAMQRTLARERAAREQHDRLQRLRHRAGDDHAA